MKKLLYIVPLLLGMALTSCYDEDIENINSRLDAIENTQIATISQQITSINNSILLLNNTDKELSEYITALEAEAENLQNQLTATNTKIDEVKTEVLSTISTEKANILAELEALRNTTTTRLEEINATIAELKAADGDMSAQIAALEKEAKELEAKLNETNSKIDSVKNELTETISTEKANILAELEAFKATVNGELDAIKAVLETLKAKDVELDGKIATLQEYVDNELKATEDWATATFATLEQYNEVVATIATIEGAIEGLNESISALETRINEKIAKDIETACATLSADLQNAVKNVTEAYTSAIATAKNELTEAYTAALEGAISALETSMKEWVNEQLTGYYTIADIDAKLEALETATTEGDEALQKEIDALKEQLASQKTELTEAYNKAIEEAINTNNGVINEKIATEIGTVNEKIGALEKRLNSLEERISAVEDAIEQIKALDIIFGNTDELACLAGASASVDYTIVGGDEQTTVEAFGDGGWSADIVAESATTGKVVVTAPSEISKRGKVVVLATSGAGGVAMKSLYFDEGVLTGILDTYEVDWVACTLAVTLKTNLSYSVEIPVEAQEWISIAESTRATVRTETITLSIAENTKELPRSATLKIIGEGGDTLYQLQIIQHVNNRASNGYRALFVRFSGLEEGYSPYYIAAFDTLSKSEAYKNSYIEVVAHTYSRSATVYCNLGIDKYYGISAFPTVICNNTTTLSNNGYERNLQTLKKQIDSYHTDTPKVNICADVRKDGDKYLIDVIIKVNDAGNYRVGGWLVEDNIEAVQYNNGCKVEGVDFNIHNGVLRATCGDTADEQFTGIDLGYLERNQIVERTLIIEPQQTSATNTQILNQLYCRAVVFVNEQDKNDEIMTVNTITTDYITSK